MKIKILTVLAGVSLALTAAADTQNGMDGWFYSSKTHAKRSMIIQNTTPPDPPPGVPLDGGLIGLIAAGGAVGYKRYKKMNDDSTGE
jgi:hypothetical protein|tara:strand:- start:1553 stop:1813 length:261 start_codon:yes stop_codon:yes gene_type:complete